MANQRLRAVADLTEDDREELRLALVMTGGSSLAVWMGGVTNEVNRLRRGQGPYGDVLALMHSTARVDVISGTSAGGLNGAMIGMAIARKDSSLESLRTLWQTTGSFEKLFRDPFQPDPPSLLEGDAYFLKSLRDAIEKLATGTPTPAADNPVDLMMTGSLLVGRDSASPDDFGSLIVDSDHRALFRFRRGGGSGHAPGCSHRAELAANDDFTGTGAASRLALAARSSASFPVVFEPSFVPIGDDDATPERPNMRCYANFRKSRYVLDGGVLMNKPIEPALQAIFELPASRQVRRVLAYVVPDPGERVIEEATPQDEMPTVARVALDSLVTLPRNESVAADLEELKRHNERARLQRDTRFRIVLALEPPGVSPADYRDGTDALDAAAERLYDAYRGARVKMSVTRILEHVAGAVNDVGGGDAPLWNLEPLRGALESHRRPLLPDAFPTPAEFAGQQWRWGVQTLEHVGAIAMDLMRRPLRMTNPRRDDMPAIRDARDVLMAARNDVYDRLARVREIRDNVGGGFWRNQAGDAIAALASPEPGALDTWARESFAAWPGGGTAGEEAATRLELGRIALGIAADLVAAAPAIEVLTRTEAAAGEGATTGDTTVLAGERDPATLLRSVMQAVVRPGNDATLRKLLALHVVETVFAPGAQELEQVVELIQISGNTPNGFDGRSKAAGKIAGVKMGHFAAFYKRSWRANDWMWGRMDGAYRLSQILLDPARLRQLEYGAAEVADLLEPIVLGPEGSDERAVLADGSPRGWDRTAALAELAFLDPVEGAPPAALPASLPVCARSLARRIQLDLLAEELPNVGDAIEMDVTAKAYESPETRAFAREVEAAQTRAGGTVRPADRQRLFPQCTIGDESVTDEMHSDLFAATASKAAAVVTSVGQGSQVGISALRGAFAFVRGIVMAVYLMAQNAVRGGAFGYALMVLAVAVGAICIGAATVDDGGSSAFLTVGVALVGGGFLYAAIRANAPRAIFALLFSVAVATSPELLFEIGEWLERSGSAWAASGFAEVAGFARDNRAAFVMAGLFAGPVLLGLAGRARRLEGFAHRHPVVSPAVVGGAVALAIALAAWGTPGAKPSPTVVRFEFAGTAAAVDSIKAAWSAEELRRVEVLTAGDFAFIALYVALVASVVSVAAGLWSRRPHSGAAVSLGRLIPGAVVVAGAFDAVENVLIFRLVGSPVSGNALPGTMWVLAAVKFAIVGGALVYAAIGVVAGLRAPRKVVRDRPATDAG